MGFGFPKFPKFQFGFDFSILQKIEFEFPNLSIWEAMWKFPAASNEQQPVVSNQHKRVGRWRAEADEQSPTLGPSATNDVWQSWLSLSLLSELGGSLFACVCGVVVGMGGKFNHCSGLNYLVLLKQILVAL